MRVGIAVSVAMHAAIVLWLVLAPGSRPFDPAYADAVVVDLVPAKENPADHDPPKPDVAASDSPKPDPPKFDPPKPDLPKFDLPKPDLPKLEPLKPDFARQAAKPPTPTSAKPDSKPPLTPEPPKPVAEAKQLPEEQTGTSPAETAARLAWMIEGPPDLPVDLAALSTKSNLPAELVAEIKERVGKCFARIPDASGRQSLVVLRIVLKRDGTLSAEPELQQAPASEVGPPLVASAKRALRQCQPYDVVPADKYAEWRVLDLSFTAEGMAGASAYRNDATR